MFQAGSVCCVPEFSMQGYPLSPKNLKLRVKKFWFLSQSWKPYDPIPSTPYEAPPNEAPEATATVASQRVTRWGIAGHGPRLTRGRMIGDGLEVDVGRAGVVEANLCVFVPGTLYESVLIFESWDTVPRLVFWNNLLPPFLCNPWNSHSAWKQKDWRGPRPSAYFQGLCLGFWEVGSSHHPYES